MPLRRVVLSVCAGALLLAPAAIALVGEGTPATAFSPAIVLNDDTGATTGGAEPSIEVDSFDNVYVSAPVGVPTGGCPFWEVEPDSNTYAYRGTIDTDRFSVGGGDCDISLTDNPAAGATHDTASITSLSLANLTVNRTSDGGKTFETVANPAAQQVFGVDRQWQASDRSLDRHYLSVHDLATSNIQVAVSIDGGYSYVSNRPAIDPTTNSRSLAAGVLALNNLAGGNSFGTTVVDETTHKLYIPFTSTRGAGFTHEDVYVAVGDPCTPVPCTRGLPAGPITWTNHLVHSAPEGQDLSSGFPAIAIDDAGTVFVGWAGDPGSSATSRISVTRMVTPGDHLAWTTPVVVDTGAARSNVFPWLVAGTGGRAGIAWYAATESNGTCVGPAGPSAGTNDSCRNDWTVQYSATHDNGATWAQQQVSQGLIHEGAICLAGLDCPTGTRTLLDFFDVALDSAGRPNFAYNSDIRVPGTADIHYTRQCSGPTLTGLELAGPCGSVVTTGSPTPTGSVCPGGGAGFRDKAGDATEVLVTGETPLPNDPALDILDGSVSWDAASSTAVFRFRVADLTVPPTAGDAYYRYLLTFGGDTTTYSVAATRPADGSAPTYDFFSQAVGVTAQVLEGSVDESTGIVEVRLPSANYVAARTGNTALTGERVVTISSVLGQRVAVLVTPTADTAETVCSAAIAQPVVVTTSPTATATATSTATATATATATPTETVSSTPTPTPTVTVTPTQTVSPTPTCTTKADGGKGQDRCKDKGGAGQGQGGATSTVAVPPGPNRGPGGDGRHTS